MRHKVLNLDVPAALHQAVKMQAVKEGRKMREIIIEAIINYLNTNK